jgi:hypothetical protein
MQYYIIRGCLRKDKRRRYREEKVEKKVSGAEEGVKKNETKKTVKWSRCKG